MEKIMTFLYKKNGEDFNFYTSSPINQNLEYRLKIVNDYSKAVKNVDLDFIRDHNDRFTLFIVPSVELKDLVDGLHTYTLIDNQNQIIDSGSIKIETNDFGQDDSVIEYKADVAKQYIVFEKRK